MKCVTKQKPPMGLGLTANANGLDSGISYLDSAPPNQIEFETLNPVLRRQIWIENPKSRAIAAAVKER